MAMRGKSGLAWMISKNCWRRGVLAWEGWFRWVAVLRSRRDWTAGEIIVGVGRELGVG